MEAEPSMKSSVTNRLQAVKRKSGKSFNQIAEETGLTNVYVAQLLKRQAQLKPETAPKLRAALPDLPDELLHEMMRPPMRSYDPNLIQEPTVYRLNEAVMHFGESIKEIVNEEFGDGIMSAIDFYCSVDKVKGVDGKDRVVVTFDGKYLPYSEQMPKKTISSKKRSRDSVLRDRFRSRTAQRLYEEHFSQRNPCLERNVLEDELRDSGVTTMLLSRGWGSLLSGFIGPSATLVQEFYANMKVVSPTYFTVFLRGHRLVIDSSVLSRVLAIPEVDYPQYPWQPGQGPSDQTILDVATGHHRSFTGGTIVVATLLPYYRLLNRIVCHNLWPKSHINTQPISRIAFLYAIEQGLSIDILDLILREMTRTRTSTHSVHTLPYGCLIRRIVTMLVPGFVHDAPLPLLKPIGRQTLSSAAAHLASHARESDMSQAADPDFVPPADPPAAAVASSSVGAPPDFYQRLLETQNSILSQLQLVKGGVSETLTSLRRLETQVDRLYENA